jgi:hypothetical protein
MRMHTPLLMNSALFVNWPGGNFPEKARRFAGAPRKYYKKSVQILRERKKKKAEGICECRINFSLARHNIAAGCSSSSPAVLLYLHSKSKCMRKGEIYDPSLRNISVCRKRGRACFAHLLSCNENVSLLAASTRKSRHSFVFVQQLNHPNHIYHI